MWISFVQRIVTVMRVMSGNEANESDPKTKQSCPPRTLSLRITIIIVARTVLLYRT